MAFDIRRLDDGDYEEDVFNEYQDELIELFANSPEGQARAQADPGMGFWVARLIDYGYSYAGTILTMMTEDDVEELLTDVFPRKVSLNAPEEADDALPALIAFWEYLKREYNLSNADHILRYLRSVKPEQFRKWMNDSSRFGMAKSIFMMGRNAGFDMTDEKDSAAFINMYNANLLSSRQSDPSPALGDRESDLSFTLGIGGGKKKADPKAKRRRKIAKESRKRNRKRK